MRVQYIVVSFTDVEMLASDIPKLRGYFIKKYPETHLFHNHLPGMRFSYKAPCIQYRIIDSHPALIGINDGIDIMKRVFTEVDQLEIGKQILRTYERDITIYEEPFGFCEEYHEYSFQSPWMALNETNYPEFIKLNPFEQMNRLKALLKNNLKTLSKAFDYWIPNVDKLHVDGWFKPVDVNSHNVKMHCFRGEFTTNFYIPDYLGLGKQSSRGFGVVTNIRRHYDS